MERKIAVVGAGVMGTGISQVLIGAGFSVTLIDVEENVLARAGERIKTYLKRQEEKGILDSASLSEAMGRLDLSLSLKSGVSGSSFVIEAVPEKITLKREIFSTVSGVASPETIFATNTSELSVTAIASATPCPGRVIGMHWFNPATRMKLIEIVVGVETSDDTLSKTVALSKSVGKEPVIVKDRQGFVTTRVLSAFLIECYRVLQEGVATMGDIDRAVRLAFNHPMGPFELSDLIGLDTLYYASRGLTDAYGERFKAPQVLVKLVEAGKLGVKSKEGFYRYDEEGL